jgi:cytochrome c oxidase subunit 1
MHDMTSASATQHHAPPQGFIRKHVFSLDHKVIGLQYYGLALVAVFIGMFLSWLMRVHLVWPNSPIPGLHLLSKAGAPGDVMTPEYYLSLLTMHGTLMVFFVLTTAPQSGFGNYFLPIQIGAADMAFPRLNMLSLWVTVAAFFTLIASFFLHDGSPLSGWTAYPPLSGMGQVTGPGEGTGQTLWVISIALFCLGALLGALNFIATTIDLRAPGMSMMRMPLTCWAWVLTAILGLLAFGVLLAAGILLLLDRTAGTSFFLPAGLVVNDQLQPHAGGSPLLYQHLFWFFGHPEVYIAILPGMGVVSHVISTFCRKPIFGYKAMVIAMNGIGFLGFMVWGHHMFVSGMSPYSGFAFSVVTMAIGVPSAIKTFNWIGTLWGGKIQFEPPMLFAIGFVSMFVSGGLSGIFLAQPAVDNLVHATYYVVAHFHLVMGVASIFGVFAATYFWFPKMFGRMMNPALGKLHFWLSFAGAYCIFMPMHFLGLVGGIRRYADYSAISYMAELHPLTVFVTYSAFVTAAAQLIFLYNFFWSIRHGAVASKNPWHATTLEWITDSPPPHDNFGGEYPSVYRGPYDFSVPGMKEDFIPQHLEPAAVARENFLHA